MIQEMIVRDYGVIERLVEQNQKELDEAGRGGEARRKSRTIIHDGKFIYLYQNNYGKEDYLIYSPKLYHYLAIPSKCTFRVNTGGRTQVEFLEHGYSALLYRFIYYFNEYCEKAGMKIDQFVSEFKAISNKAFSSGIEVDHANDDKDNNCYWNLSLMKSGENGRKNRLLANIKPPYYCFIVAMPDGDYRIEFGYIAPHKEVAGIIGQKWFIHCQAPGKLIDFLRKIFTEFVSVDQLPPHLADWGNPQYIRATYKDQKYYFAGNFETTARVAERLLAMDAEQFIEWDGNMKWVALHP